MKNGAFLFDMDGTLVDNMNAVQDAFFEIVRQLGGDINDGFRSKMADMLGGVYAHRHKKLLEGKLIWDAGRLLGFGYYRRMKMIYRAYMELRDVSFRAPLFNDTIPTLTHLKERGYKLALVTMRKKKYIFKESLMQPLKEFFDAVIGRHDANDMKPNPAPVLEAAKQLDIHPTSCVMVGDMPLDIQAGKNAQALTVGLLTGLFKKGMYDCNPDFVFKNLSELVQNIKHIETMLEQRRLEHGT